MGPPGQPDYVNAAALVASRLEPLELLDALQAIERSRGRRRSTLRWGPRVIDLDILVMGRRTWEDERLRLPHPQLHRRAFVLVPLSEGGPAGLEVPGVGVLGDLVRACDRSGVSPLQ